MLGLYYDTHALNVDMQVVNRNRKQLKRHGGRIGCSCPLHKGIDARLEASRASLGKGLDPWWSARGQGWGVTGLCGRSAFVGTALIKDSPTSQEQC